MLQIYHTREMFSSLNNLPRDYNILDKSGIYLARLLHFNRDWTSVCENT